MVGELNDMFDQGAIWHNAGLAPDLVKNSWFHYGSCCYQFF